MLDSAEVYMNEKETGVAIKQALDEGLCKREDLFVVSKLWGYFHRPERVREAVLRSLKDLQVDYLDLYLIHYPIALKYREPPIKYPGWIHDENAYVPRMELDEGVTYQQTWEAMEQLVREGLVRNIGVSNVATGKILDILKYAKIKPAIV